MGGEGLKTGNSVKNHCYFFNPLSIRTFHFPLVYYRHCQVTICHVKNALLPAWGLEMGNYVKNQFGFLTEIPRFPLAYFCLCEAPYGTVKDAGHPFVESFWF